MLCQKNRAIIFSYVVSLPRWDARAFECGSSPRPAWISLMILRCSSFEKLPTSSVYKTFGHPPTYKACMLSENWPSSPCLFGSDLDIVHLLRSSSLQYNSRDSPSSSNVQHQMKINNELSNIIYNVYIKIQWNGMFDTYLTMQWFRFFGF